MPEATLVLGKHSGRHAVQRRCEQIGITLARHELDQVYRAVMTLADREKVVTDANLRQIVETIGETEAATASGTAPSAPDFTLTPAESGYGHGV